MVTPKDLFNTFQNSINYSERRELCYHGYRIYTDSAMIKRSPHDPCKVIRNYRIWEILLVDSGIQEFFLVVSEILDSGIRDLFSTDKESGIKYLESRDHYTFLGTCPPTHPISQHFALSEK